jgi:isopentenyl diphosphate isomerase/L-lactate dehydrogenase-like FMN-dependent dehydrogenase
MDQSLGWKDIAWIRRHWSGAIVIKGIQSVADARLALEQGVDGLVVSNHGGRQLEGAPATLSLLPEIADAVGHKLDVLLDGGGAAATW